MKATPQIFTGINVIENHRDDQKRDVLIRCHVDAGMESEDEIDDLFQAIVDISCRMVAREEYVTVSINLELPDLSSPEPEFLVSRRVEVVKHLPTQILVRTTHYDPNDFSVAKVVHTEFAI